MSKKSFPFLLLFYFQFLSTSVFAQILSTTADAKVATAYSGRDSIFVFNQSSPKKGTLRATIPGGGSATFAWSAYDTVNHIFLPAFQTDANVSFSVTSNLNAGGYRVHITKPGWDTTMMAWVFLNDFTFSVEKNNAGEVHFYRRTCEFTNLQANATPARFKYFNPATQVRYTLNNSIIVTWTANPANGVSLGEGSKIWIEGEDLPTENTEYTGRGTDNFKLSKEDKVKYISIIPKAEFEIDYPKKYSDSVISAPVRVTFTNNSKNAVNYTWIFGDGDTVRMKEPENTPEPHIYYRANQLYKLKLIAYSKEGCLREDTASIRVAKSELEAPNVFTPNEDGDNDYFVIRNVSMREFHVTIFTRSGRKVYEFNGPDINSWEGWNGRMGNTLLSSGVYYYILEAASLEQPSVKYRPTKYSGFFYLIR